MPIIIPGWKATVKAWINGGFVAGDKASVPLLSHSFSRGTALFEVMDIVATIDGPAYFGLNEHINRLFHSAKLMRMELPYGPAEIMDACVLTARENGIREGGAKLFAYYPSEEYTILPRNNKIDIAVFTIDFADLGFNKEDLSSPAKVGISSYRKMDPDIVPVHAKVTGNYVNAYLAMMEAREKELDEVLLIDTRGYVAEGVTSSAFFVKEGVLRVPPLEKVLSGITRMAVIELARDLNIPVDISDILPTELLTLDEGFFASSFEHVRPMLSIEGKALGGKCPGPVTGKIIESMNDLLSGRNKKYRRWLRLI